MKINAHARTRPTLPGLLLALILPALVLTGCATLKGGSGQAAGAAGEPFTVVMIPDTQCYADVRLGRAGERWDNDALDKLFYRQTEWIAEKRDELNIVMAAHVGDITQTDFPAEWEIADRAFDMLDGEVPYCLSVGNHDMGYRFAGTKEQPKRYETAISRETHFNEYFPPSRFEGRPWYGGHYGEGNENNYCLFEGGGMEFLMISLEFKPRDEVLEWANEIVAKHHDRRVIVITHAFLNPEDKRQDIAYRVEGNGGEEMWEKFVSRHQSIFMVLNGHYFGEGRLTTVGANGNDVHQMLADYQDTENGGNAYLRVLTFHPREDRIDVTTYSPALDAHMTGPSSEFSLQYDMEPALAR